MILLESLTIYNKTFDNKYITENISASDIKRGYPYKSRPLVNNGR